MQLGRMSSHIYPKQPGALFSLLMCRWVEKHIFLLGDGHSTFNRESLERVWNQPLWNGVDGFIPYKKTEPMGVDRPKGTHEMATSLTLMIVPSPKLNQPAIQKP